MQCLLILLSVGNGREKYCLTSSEMVETEHVSSIHVDLHNGLHSKASGDEWRGSLGPWKD